MLTNSIFTRLNELIITHIATNTKNDIMMYDILVNFVYFVYFY